MKYRRGFISNSSSTSFTITNISRETKTTEDFVEEIGEEMIQLFDEEFGIGHLCKDDEGITLYQLLKDAKSDPYHVKFKPGQSINIAFGDEQGPVLGHIFDYILREGGKSKSFTWKFHEYLR